MFRTGETFSDQYVIKGGVLNDINALDQAKPGAELFTEHRVGWVLDNAGASQLKGMGS
jgi:hypothetical protein